MIFVYFFSSILADYFMMDVEDLADMGGIDDEMLNSILREAGTLETSECHHLSGGPKSKNMPS